MRFKDLTGQKIGKLTVLRRYFKSNDTGTFWICECECGTIKTINAGNLGKTKTWI
jgi:hypothetical protein